MRTSILTLLFLIFGINSYSQSTITICNTDSTSKRVENIKILIPFRNFYNSRFVKNDHTLTLKGGEKYCLGILNEGVVQLRGNFETLLIPIFKGDSISVFINTKKQEITFTGKGACGINEYGQIQNSIVPKLIDAYDSTSSKDEYLAKISCMIENAKVPFYRYFMNGSMSKDHLQHAIYYIENTFYYRIMTTLMYRVKEKDWVRHPEKEINELVGLLDDKYDPFQKKYDNSSNAQNAKLTKCTLMEWNMIPFKVKHTIWDSTSFQCLNFLPINSQEPFLGNELINAILEKDIAKIKRFETLLLKHFPNSEYLKETKEEREPSIEKYDKKKVVKKGKPLNLSIDDFTIQDWYIVFEQRDSTFSFDGFGNINDSDFDSFLKKCVPNKVIFIDFWATWCSPCVSELRYSQQLHEHLKKMGILPVYISIDAKDANSTWNKKIKEMQIEGMHIHASEKLIKSINKKLKTGINQIPRYILIDPKGNVLDENLPRPSNIKELNKRLKELVK